MSAMWKMQGRRVFMAAATLVLAQVLAGCNTTFIPSWVSGTTAYGIVEGVSLNQTGKTASDHLASLATGDDCSILDYTKTGKYCRTAAEMAQEQAEKNRPYPGYCYRQRASVVCYKTPDPNATDPVETYPEAKGY